MPDPKPKSLLAQPVTTDQVRPATAQLKHTRLVTSRRRFGGWSNPPQGRRRQS